MIPLLAIIIFMMNFFSSLHPREGGARQHAGDLRHFALSWIVQDFDNMAAQFCG